MQTPLEHTYAAAVPELSVPWPAEKPPRPEIVWLNHELARELGYDPQQLRSEDGIALLTGQIDGTVAQAYAGHQFGGFSPQLGDGRALLLGEVIDRHGRRRDIAFKGSGRTPFSRGGDGKAAVGPVLREYLMGEAMHALGIPTTRALAAVATGETIFRDQPLHGAILTRVAASHLRVGTFQFFAARGDHERVRHLADYAIARHDPGLQAQADRHLALLRAVCERQARLVAQWMGVGFIHGVMNTDNMTISGETIDYGPCAFLEAYDPATVFSSIDHQGRYAFGNQPGIAQWNLARLAETLLPLIDTDEDTAVARATEALDGFGPAFDREWLRIHRRKIGLLDDPGNEDTDRALLHDYLGLLHRHRVDFTLGFRRLSDALRSPAVNPLAPLFGAGGAELASWLARWRQRLQDQGTPPADVADAMDAANPLYIPRNHLVENALDAATGSMDLRPFERLLAVVTRPYDERPEDALCALPGSAEQTEGYRTFCGT